MGQSIKGNVLLLVAVVMVALLVSACTYPGIPPGMKIRIRSGSPAPQGSELATRSNIPDSDLDSESNISDSDAKPKLASSSASTTESEELVKQVLLKSERAWNEKNKEVFLSLFSEDAQIMIGREQKIVSKADYAKMFPAAFDKAGTVKYESLSVEILDAKTARAEGVGSISAEGGIIWLTKKLQLIKNQKGGWLIEESTFEIYFRGDVDPRDTFRPRARGDSL